MSKVPAFQKPIQIIFNIFLNDKDPKNHDIQVLIRLITNLPDEDINKKDRNGDTVLHHLAYYGHCNIIPIILERDTVRPNLLNNWGITPLHRACHRKGNVDTVKLLVEHPKININKRNTDGLTVLHEACDYNDYDIVSYLLKNDNIDPNAVADNNITPFMMACMTKGSEKIIRLLLSDSRVNFHIKSDIYNFDGYDLAEYYSNINILPLLRQVFTDKRPLY